MEKKNMVLLTVIAVATLLVAVVGATFAYFTATVQNDFNQDESNGKTELQAAKVPNEIAIEKVGNAVTSFNVSDIYPGHKELIALKVTAKKADGIEDEVKTYFNIAWKGTVGSFDTKHIKFTVFESSDAAGIKDDELSDGKAYNCEKKVDNEENKAKYYETCTIKDDLKYKSTQNVIFEKTLSQLTQNEESGYVINDSGKPFSIVGTKEGTTMYYFVVVEYVNDELAENQNTEQGQTFTGTISVQLAPESTNAIDASQSTT